MKKILLSRFTALITLFLLLVIRAHDTNFIESVRLRYFDRLIAMQPSEDIDISIVNIDEASLDKYGQFPFPRDVYGKIIQDIYDRNAKLIVFNILMPESDRFGKDKSLADRLKNIPIVLPILASTRSKNDIPSTSVQSIGVDHDGKFVDYPGIISNIGIIQQNARGAGIVNTFPEIDGVVRRVPLLVSSTGIIYPALSLETLRVMTDDDKIQVKIDINGVEKLRIPGLRQIFTDNVSRIWIDHRFIPKQYSLTSMPDDFKNQIVIVGANAAGLVNPIPTSMGELWPQELQASIIGTISKGNVITRTQTFDLIELSVILLSGIYMVFMMRYTYIGIFAMIGIIASLIYASMYMYEHYLYLFDVTFPVFALVIVGLHAFVIKFIYEFLQKQQIRKQFSSYLSPDLVAKLIKDPSLLKLGGEEKELTILFSDVRGFTSISEHYGKNVQGLTKIMNRYMTAMTRKILENYGTLDKYIGDAQMAFWNAPLDETKHCKDAVKAALEMLDSLAEFNGEIKKENVPAFGMGIGINTGVVVVGNMGSEQRFDYTCLGDAVNLASRLEGQSKNYGVHTVLGPTTAERVKDEYFTIELDCIAVKGKQEGVKIYTVFYNPSDKDLKKYLHDREVHDLMLSYYRKQDWNKASGLAIALKGAFGGKMDDYYTLWQDRITEMQNKQLPVDWDGIYRATSK